MIGSPGFLMDMSTYTWLVYAFWPRPFSVMASRDKQDFNASSGTASRSSMRRCTYTLYLKRSNVFQQASFTLKMFKEKIRQNSQAMDEQSHEAWGLYHRSRALF